MAVHNEELMANYRIANAIPMERQLLTYDQWRRIGMQVKKGEKAHYQTDLWVPFKGKKKEEQASSDNETTDNKEKKLIRCRMKLCYFFTQDQVEPMKQKED